MLFLADAHEKGQKRGGAQPAAKGLKNRRAVEAEAAELNPGDQSVAEI